MINTNTIFCYSATGNSLASANQLSKQLHMPVCHINAEIVEKREEIECEFCVIIFPTYAFAPPKLVRKFVKNCTFKVSYLAVLTTCGSICGGALAEMTRLFKRKKQKVCYVNSIKTVENYVHMFGHKSGEKIAALTKNQQEITEQIGASLAQRALKGKKTFTPVSVLISCAFKAFTPLFAKFYKVKSTCNGCGVCARVCPTLAISMQEKNGKTLPAFAAKKCDHCQACMQLCPQKAIKFMRVTPTSKRYMHPNTTLTQLLKR